MYIEKRKKRVKLSTTAKQQDKHIYSQAFLPGAKPFICRVEEQISQKGTRISLRSMRMEYIRLCWQLIRFACELGSETSLDANITRRIIFIVIYEHKNGCPERFCRINRLDDELEVGLYPCLDTEKGKTET